MTWLTRLHPSELRPRLTRAECRVRWGRLNTGQAKTLLAVANGTYVAASKDPDFDLMALWPELVPDARPARPELTQEGRDLVEWAEQSLAPRPDPAARMSELAASLRRVKSKMQEGLIPPSMPAPEVPASVQGALQASGFPFQTAIEDVIRKADGWEILATEASSKHPDGSDQFLDLVARAGHFVIGVECKKSTKEALTFLLPEGPRATETGNAWLLYADQIRDSSRRWAVCCGRWVVGPPYFESSFCVVSTSPSGKDQRLLERDAGRLILGTEAEAHRRVGAIPVSALDELGWPFIPLLVTNAPLFVARYEATDISLETGEFTKPPKDVASVPWVRFERASRHRAPRILEIGLCSW